MIGAPSRFRLTRKAAALARVLPTFALSCVSSCEENAARRKWNDVFLKQGIKKREEKNISDFANETQSFYFFTLVAEVVGPKWFRCTRQETPKKIAVRIYLTSDLCCLIHNTEDFEYVCHCRQWQVRIPSSRSDTDFMLSILCRVPMMTSRDRTCLRILDFSI